MGECQSRHACPHLGFRSCDAILAERDRLIKQVENKDVLIGLAAEEIENLRAENESLRQEKESLLSKLKRRLRKDLGISEQSDAEEHPPEEPAKPPEQGEPKRKRGAPKGHRGATRKKPGNYKARGRATHHIQSA